ncbi:hypothetical protein CSUI_004882 [Cystoisospora suis]|uniref:Uncharacterized protein n=1 Tax=Cystoisospora suis TaxID=483139 RepID=A0A2C6KX57_9APIC|nr:hypothetical protein CSUI_004882 [Cystoisospora suis]
MEFSSHEVTARPASYSGGAAGDKDKYAAKAGAQEGGAGDDEEEYNLILSPQHALVAHGTSFRNARSQPVTATVMHEPAPEEITEGTGPFSSSHCIALDRLSTENCAPAEHPPGPESDSTSVLSSPFTHRLNEASPPSRQDPSSPVKDDVNPEPQGTSYSGAESSYAVRIVVTGPTRWRGDLSFQGTPAILCSVVSFSPVYDGAPEEENSVQPCHSAKRGKRRMTWKEEVLIQKSGWGPLVLEEVIIQTRQLQHRQWDEDQPNRGTPGRAVQVLTLQFHRDIADIPTAPSGGMILPSSCTAALAETHIPLSELDLGPTEAKYRLTLSSPLLPPSWSSVDELMNVFRAALHSSARGANRCNVIIFSLRASSSSLSSSTAHQLFLLHSQQQQRKLLAHATSGRACAGNFSFLTPTLRDLSKQNRPLSSSLLHLSSLSKSRGATSVVALSTSKSLTAPKCPLKFIAGTPGQATDSVMLAEAVSVVSAPTQRVPVPEEPAAPREPSTASVYEREGTLPEAVAQVRPAVHGNKSYGILSGDADVETPNYAEHRDDPAAQRQASPAASSDACRGSAFTNSLSRRSSGATTYGTRLSRRYSPESAMNEDCTGARRARTLPDTHLLGRTRSQARNPFLERTLDSGSVPGESICSEGEDIFPDDSVSVKGRAQSPASSPNLVSGTGKVLCSTLGLGREAGGQRNGTVDVGHEGEAAMGAGASGGTGWSSDGGGESSCCCSRSNFTLAESCRKTTLTSSIKRMDFLMNQAQQILQRRQLKQQQRILLQEQNGQTMRQRPQERPQLPREPSQMIQGYTLDHPQQKTDESASDQLCAPVETYGETYRSSVEERAAPVFDPGASVAGTSFFEPNSLPVQTDSSTPTECASAPTTGMVHDFPKDHTDATGEKERTLGPQKPDPCAIANLHSEEPHHASSLLGQSAESQGIGMQHSAEGIDIEVPTALTTTAGSAWGGEEGAGGRESSVQRQETCSESSARKREDSPDVGSGLLALAADRSLNSRFPPSFAPLGPAPPPDSSVHGPEAPPLSSGSKLTPAVRNSAHREQSHRDETREGELDKRNDVTCTANILGKHAEESSLESRTKEGEHEETATGAGCGEETGAGELDSKSETTEKELRAMMLHLRQYMVRIEERLSDYPIGLEFEKHSCRRHGRSSRPGRDVSSIPEGAAPDCAGIRKDSQHGERSRGSATRSRREGGDYQAKHDMEETLGCPSRAGSEQTEPEEKHGSDNRTSAFPERSWRKRVCSSASSVSRSSECSEGRRSVCTAPRHGKTSEREHASSASLEKRLATDAHRTRDGLTSRQALYSRNRRLGAVLRWMTERNEGFRRDTLQRAFLSLVRNSAFRTKERMAAFQKEQEQSRATIERLQSELSAARSESAILSSQINEARQQHETEKQQLRDESEATLKERINAREVELQQAAESQKAHLERQLAETQSQLSDLQKKYDEEKLANASKQAVPTNQMCPQQAQNLAAAYKSLCKKAELEEALHQQELSRKETEVKDLLSQLQKQNEVTRQQEAENRSLRLRLQAALTQQQALHRTPDPQQVEPVARGGGPDGSSGATLSSVRENEDLRRQLQDAKQEMTRQQQKIRLLEDQHRSFTICSSSSAGSSPAPPDVKGNSMVPPTSTPSTYTPGSYEQIRQLQQQLADAEKDRSRLLALEQQREKEKLQLVDLFSLQSMRVRELEQQLVHIDDQLAKVLSQVGPCPLQHQSARDAIQQQYVQGRASDRDSSTQRREERERRASSRTRAEHRNGSQERTEGSRTQALPAVQSVPCLNKEKQTQPGAVVLQSAALQRLQGMRATLKRVQEQLPAVVGYAHNTLSSAQQEALPHSSVTMEEKAAAVPKGFTAPPYHRSLLSMSNDAAQAALCGLHEQQPETTGQAGHYSYGGFKGTAPGQKHNRSEPRSCSPHSRGPAQRYCLGETRTNDIESYHYAMSKCRAFHLSGEKIPAAASSRISAAATGLGVEGSSSSRDTVPGGGSVLVPSMKSRQQQAQAQLTRVPRQGQLQGGVAYRYATPSRLQQHTQLLDGSEAAGASRAAAGTSPFRQPLCHRRIPL